MAEPLQVEVVSADEVVWSGASTLIVARTVEGEIGILPGHEPVLAVLDPGAVEVVTPDGTREIVAVDGGFLSVAQGRVSVLSEYARLAEEIDLDAAERELSEAQAQLDAGEGDDDVQQRLARAGGQVRAARRVR